MPATTGEVHTLPAKLPPLALHIKLFVTPPLAVAANVTVPGAKIWFAGVIGVIVTGVGVTMQVVDTTSPVGPVTVNVYVLPAVSAGVAYDPPLTADAVISELPTPADPITAVPFENVGTRLTVPL